VRTTEGGFARDGRGLQAAPSLTRCSIFSEGVHDGGALLRVAPRGGARRGCVCVLGVAPRRGARGGHDGVMMDGTPRQDGSVVVFRTETSDRGRHSVRQPRGRATARRDAHVRRFPACACAQKK
jgi:hypothetical protein